MNLHLLLLIAYSAVLIGLGAWIGRRVRSSGDFFVAGRGLGPGLLFSTMLAANIGAGSTVGATGLGYREGDFPESERQSQSILSLPIHEGLEERDLEAVVKAIRAF